MDKILVRLYVPALEKQYDVKIPANRKIANVISLLTQAVSDLSEGQFDINKSHVLYDKLTGKEYSIMDSVSETNIKSGKEIILM